MLCSKDMDQSHICLEIFLKVYFIIKKNFKRKISIIITTLLLSLETFNYLDFSVSSTLQHPPCFCFFSTSLIIFTIVRMPVILFLKMEVTLCCVFLQEGWGLVLMRLPVQQCTPLTNMDTLMYAF